MGEKFHEGQGQIVHWWQHIRYGEENEQPNNQQKIYTARTDDNGALGVRALGSGREGFLQRVIVLIIRSELDVNINCVAVAKCPG